MATQTDTRRTTEAAETDPSKLLGIYLQDHHAGSVTGLNLARRIAGQNSDSPDAGELRAIAGEIEADQTTLEELMERLDVSPDPIKDRLAWAGEKLGRLKRNGTWVSYSPLSRVVELEGLFLGVTGKLSLWEALRATLGDTAHGIDFARLAERAEDQLARLGRLRRAAVEAAFSEQRTAGT